MPITDEQFDKLPKYARVEIQGLRRSLEYAENQVRQVAGEEDSRITLDPYIAKIPLPDNLTVGFQLGEKHQEHIEVDLRPGVLKVHGGQKLVIYPSSANSIELQTERF